MDDTVCKLVVSESELESAFEVRRLVFVEEQDISEALEYDGLDDEAVHIIARHEDKVVGTARVRFPSRGHAKIERMAVLGPFRHQGIGGLILSFVNSELRTRQIQHVLLHAQVAVIEFYRLQGFQETGPYFMEADIKHVAMQMHL